MKIALLTFLFSCTTGLLGQVPPMPMPIQFENTAFYRWLNKEVIQSRLLDDAEDISKWRFKKTDEAKGKIVHTSDRPIDGKYSIRLIAHTKGNKPGPTMGRPFGHAIAVRLFPNEDWSNYNRISVYIYPVLPGFKTVSLTIHLENEGRLHGRDYHNVLLKNNYWNHVVWEIPDIARDNVVGLAFEYRAQGNENGAVDTVIFDIDQLELQLVEADHFEGWNVAPGKIAYSHTGYQMGAPKTAIANDLPTKSFSLINLTTGFPILTKPIEIVNSSIGKFQLMDFSEVKTPGSYMIKACNLTTKVFKIDKDIWRGTIWKAINFCYVERCGTEIPGVHHICHRDWLGVYEDKQIVINGGWHDAGDLSQGIINTAEAVYAMLSLTEKLDNNGENSDLYHRLIDEAKWGLEWVLKTSFHNGFRIHWATMDFWTNGIIGDVDDVIAKAYNTSYINYLVAATEALADRVLKKINPDLSAYCLEMAKEDYCFAIAGSKGEQRYTIKIIEEASAGILALLNLFQATEENQYLEKSLELAQVVLNCQQKSVLPGFEVPLTGFFYTSPQKDRILHYQHRGQEQAPIVALTRLCEAFPHHADWMKWYAAVALHSEYFQKLMAKLTYPYHHLPNSLYSTEEYLEYPENDQRGEIFQKQVLNGIKVGDKYYIRVYPVQPNFQFRGNFGTVLSQTKAISTAAHLRRKLELIKLCYEQLYWIVGRNPFAQSTMYGEGYDYAPQYSAMSGDIVGSLPVGIKMFGNRDVPYWPFTNLWNYKEVWIHPVSRWIWIMEDLLGPAIIEGTVTPLDSNAVMLVDIDTNQITSISPDFITGKFQAKIPEGQYEILYMGNRKFVTLLPAETYNLNLNELLNFTISSDTKSNGQVTITLTAQGKGNHNFTIRSDNLILKNRIKKVNLKPGRLKTIVWRVKMENLNTPWVAIIFPDNDLSQRMEAIGSIKNR